MLLKVGLHSAGVEGVIWVSQERQKRWNWRFPNMLSLMEKIDYHLQKAPSSTALLSSVTTKDVITL